jgi:hypothetical protein
MHVGREVPMLVLCDKVDDCITTRDATAWERIVARLHAAKLDRDLAAGASPDSTAPLAIRAQALVRLSQRRDLARGLQRVLAEANQPARDHSRWGVVPVRRERVRDASAEFQALIDHLLAPCPLPARGLAQVRVLLSDGSGPLYYPGSPADLRSTVHKAVEALEPLSSW